MSKPKRYEIQPVTAADWRDQRLDELLAQVSPSAALLLVLMSMRGGLPFTETDAIRACCEWEKIHGEPTRENLLAWLATL